MFNRDSSVKIYMNLISSLGWLGVLLSLYWLKPPNHFLIIILLIGFLCICEIFPVSTTRGSVSVSFPIIFTINTIRKKSLSHAFFESGLRTFSFILALWVTYLSFQIFWPHSLKGIIGQTIYVFLATLIYFLVKNGLLDLKNNLKRVNTKCLSWWRKNVGDLFIFLLSFFYCWLMFYLGHQDRGKVDVLSFFFFFSPLVGLTIVSTIIERLEREKSRLNMLFSITNDLKHGVTSTQSATKIITKLQKFLPIDTSIFWIKEGDEWKVTHLFGEVDRDNQVDYETLEGLENLSEVIYIPDRQNSKVSVLDHFDTLNKSFIFAPLYIENTMIGIWGIGSHNPRAFQKDDIQSMKALANQIAILIRTRNLIEEQENHKILEERNRIAREIHDGIAQMIAGAVMNLEVASKSFDTRIEDSRHLVQESLSKLRGSLKEIRQSIYALRPHPTQHIGIIQAVQNHIETFKLENPDINVRFIEKGKESPLGYIVENTIFNVLKEALRNIQKHAQATSVNITIIFKESRVVFRIKDNGLGFSLMEAMLKAKNESHFGILNMHELADGMGATLDISTKKGMGTEITLVSPKIIEEEGDINDQRHASR